MRADLKVTVYDRMTDPKFKWTQFRPRRARRGTHAFCAWGVILDEAARAGLGRWLGQGDTWQFWPNPNERDWSGSSFFVDRVRAWAGVTDADVETITTFNDTATSVLDVAEFIKNLPDQP